MDPLAQLQDIHVPEEVGLWPLAWGWWALLGLTLLSILAISFTLWRCKKLRKIRNSALRELDGMDQTNPDYFNELNALLKRTCIGYFGHESVAALYGDSWRAFLASMLGDKRKNAFESAFSELQEQMYRQPSAELLTSPNDAKTIVIVWLKHALPPSPAKIEEAKSHV
ncbi:DUF4381 domain-containing protein [Aliiglaciecola sp. M165]|uniref:DUF4381 domain-containing protein n=1 Tax=Aliiglaciecola sp. M165 TaxID=2593649 RepID=UPI00117D078D|nr:DUF4381 domain-containing protein [Aliiglaciecola sp. M165]TRY30985.1 DUF4381 domain-containing protein [Aliiglaciecola sp. M165]